MTDIFIAIIVTALVTSLIAFFFLLLGMAIADSRHTGWEDDDDE